MKQESLQQFLDDLASKAATPGGGGAAALNGAMGAALIGMVCNLTIGRKKYRPVEAEMKAILTQSEALRAKLTDLISTDAEAFDKVMVAYGLPRQTESEKQARTEAIQAATKEATLVPLAIAQACAEVIALSKPTTEMGNVNVVSDAGVGALSAQSGLKSAALNVLINLGSLQDEAFVTAKEAELNQILDGQDALTAEVYELVQAKLLA